MGETPGFGNSFSGPVYRDAFRLASYSESTTAINAADPLFAIEVGSKTPSPQYAPGSDASTRIDTGSDVFRMGPGDRLEVVGGGAGANDSTVIALITKLDPVISDAGVVVAFIERELARATFTLSTNTIGTDNPLVDAFDDIDATDRIADAASVSGTIDGVATISPGANNYAGTVLCQARQSMFMRAQVYRGTAGTHAWILARRLQGDARPIVR